MSTIFPTLAQVVKLHQRSIETYGGSPGIKDIGLVESALMAPQQTFGGEDLYPQLSDKAAALWHGLVCNHGFTDGNKRIGLVATSVFLRLNGYKFAISQVQAEEVTLRIASSQLGRQELMKLIVEHIVPL
jgi:death-on-curing protein